jgi:protein-tyrosine-phosphatase
MLNPRIFRRAGFFILAMASGIGVAQVEKQKPAPQPVVVFVCAHGAGKSVIAAAWFNKLASEQHLPYRAIARGTTPQKELSETAVAGLQRDGVLFPQDKPLPLTSVDTTNAIRVVAFDPLPASIKASRVETFDVPPPSGGYDESRDAILLHVRDVLKDLKAQSPSR